MSFSVDVLAKIAIELQTGIGHQDRFQRLISTLRHVLACDASALLRYEGRQFIPLAIDGLAQDVLGRRFTLEGHPRLETIARAGDVVRFPADSDLPDPYDGLIPGQESLKVHACIGLPLFAGQNLIGALTLDGLSPDQFDTFSDEELRLIAALAAGALNNALLIEQLESQNILPGSPAAFEQVTHTEMIGLSPGMAQLKKEIEIVAASDLNVLIFGETGTGKELVAKSIHEASPRAVNPLVYLNCAALPESVAESELFGHVKGAFTGAMSNRSGKFEMADNGTLFLDEIGELSVAFNAFIGNIREIVLEVSSSAVQLKEVALALHGIAIVDFKAQVVARHHQCGGNIQLITRGVAVGHGQRYRPQGLTIEHQLHGGISRHHCGRYFQVQFKPRRRDDLVHRQGKGRAPLELTTRQGNPFRETHLRETDAVNHRRNKYRCARRRHGWRLRRLV